MKHNKPISFVFIFSGVLLVSAAFLLWSVPKANAQCGSQMSSCKNCHEVQGKKAVNADGKPWHQSHAFGDFCQFCHAGNVQSMVKEEAHQGMVPPLQDVKASCANCHPDDLMEKAKVYADILGVQVGVSNVQAATGETPSASAPSGEAVAAPEKSSPAEAEPGPLVVDDKKVIDYNKRYEETTSGAPLDWGMIIVIGLILIVIGAGGVFVFWNEKRRRPNQPKDEGITDEKEPLLPEIKDYPADVVSLLPHLAKLTPPGRRALSQLISNPEEASELLYSLSQIDPELIRRMQNLDSRARAILLALVNS